MARRYVRVCHENYGYQGVVILARWPWTRFSQAGLRIATIDLTRDDAEEQLAEARAKAASLARSIEQLERPVAA